MMANRIVQRSKPHDVYIGRGGPWGNPYIIGTHGTRAEVIAQYRAHLWKRIQRERAALILALAKLDGATLGCYCAPQPCHGDVLARAIAWAKDRARLYAGTDADPQWDETAWLDAESPYYAPA